MAYKYEKKTGFFRYKHPSQYNFRTSPEILTALTVIAHFEKRYKCDVLEDAIKEYFERHITKDGIKYYHNRAKDIAAAINRGEY